MLNDMDLHIMLLKTFGDGQEGEAMALRWLFSSLIVFGNRTPIEMIHDGGIQSVIDILNNMKGDK